MAFRTRAEPAPASGALGGRDFSPRRAHAERRTVQSSRRSGAAGEATCGREGDMTSVDKPLWGPHGIIRG
jgi:hypothetical protein